MNGLTPRLLILLLMASSLPAKSGIENDGIGGTGQQPQLPGDEEGIGGTGRSINTPERPEVFERPDIFERPDVDLYGADNSSDSVDLDTGTEDTGTEDTATPPENAAPEEH